MNLLTDQRERQEKNSFLDDSLIPSPALHLVDDEQLTAAKADISLPSPDGGVFGKGYKKRKSFFVSFLLIFAFLGIISAAVYYGYFYKKSPKVTAVQETPLVETKIDTVATQQTPIARTESPKATKDTSRTVAVVEPPVETATIAAPSVLMACAQNLNSILESQPADVKIATLILDETSFSAEVVSNTRANAEAYHGRLKDQLRGDVSLSPTSGATGSAHSIISGNIAMASTEQSVGDLTRIADEALRAKLSELSRQSGTNLAELGIGRRIHAGGIVKVPVFIRVSGSQTQCQEYFNQIAKTGFNFRVAKIIMMASNPQLANMVLRLELLQPA